MIIEKKIEDSYYLKLDSEFESPISMLDVKSLLLKEDMKYNNPIVSLKFVDAVGEMITSSRLSNSNEYELTIGPNDKDIQICPLKIVNSEFFNIEHNTSENIFGDVNFTQSHWDEMIMKRKFRSWKEVKYSDVVEEILNEHGYTDIEVEPTKEIIDLIIQPGWSDIRLLKWIQKRAENSDGITGYQLILRLDGTASFQSLHTLKYKQPIKDLYIVGADLEIEKQFSEFTVRTEYSNMLKEGASGFKYGYYDYNNGEYVTDKLQFTDLEERQLSEWSIIESEHVSDSGFFNGGRDTDTPKIVSDRISETSNSILTMSITVKGDVIYRSGDLINLFIKPSEWHKDPVNEYYSGYYLITGVEHKFDFIYDNFITVLKLSREGLNSVDEVGLSETITGKDIKE